MNSKERNEKYNNYVNAKIPMTKNFPTLIYAYLIGGLICLLGQGIMDIIKLIFPTLGQDAVNAWMLIILIFIASFLTAIGVYDRIGVFAGAGSIVPITGFSNSITSPAVEFKKEGIIFGICVKMFTIAGPVIVNGLAVSVLIGIIYLFIWGYIMARNYNKQTIVFDKKISFVNAYSIVGNKEGNGSFKKYFDEIVRDDKFNEKSFELAERAMVKKCIQSLCKKIDIEMDKIDLIVGGDLLNQIISTSFSARDLSIPLVGIYGACSTMAESLLIGSIFIESGAMNNIICVTGSHFSTAERQYRFPLELGNQRPPTSQWTVTGAGASFLNNNSGAPYIKSATIGKIIDYGINDVNNMGAAMAPAAVMCVIEHFKNTKTNFNNYDLIITGDLGKLGSEIFIDLMNYNGYKNFKNYKDCGHMMFNNNQKTFQGGSGAGCSAVVLNSYIYSKLKERKLNNVLFVATGALLSTTTSQQGESIPGVAYAIHISNN